MRCKFCISLGMPIYSFTAVNELNSFSLFESIHLKSLNPLKNF